MVRDDAPIVGREWTRQAWIAAPLWWITAWFVAAFPWAPREINAANVILGLVAGLWCPAYVLTKRGELSLRELPDAPEGRPSRLGPRQRTLLALVVVVPPVGALLLSTVPDTWFNDLSAVEQDLLGAAGFGVLAGLTIGALLTTLRALHCRWAEWRHGDEIVRVSLRYTSWLASRPARAGARSEADAALER